MSAALALAIPVAGRYAGTYQPPSGSPDNIGILDGSGYELGFTPHGQDMNDTDAYGMTLIDGIYRGQDWRVRYRTQEWLRGMLEAIQPFGFYGSMETQGPPLGPSTTSFSPYISSAVSPVGRRYTDLSGVLVLSATAGTSAATLGPLSLTASQALLSPNTNLGMQFTTKIREVPIEMLCIPYQATISATAYVVPFVVT